MKPGKPARPTAERFREKYREDPSGCWLWLKPMPSGYGSLSYKDPVDGWTWIQAHKLAWVLANGPVPDGLWVLHKCDVAACVNPAHLFLGTAKDNIQDMIRKGRSKMGDHAKLTPEQARIAIEDYWAGRATQWEIARRHGLKSHRSIGRLVRRETYIRAGAVALGTAEAG